MRRPEVAVIIAVIAVSFSSIFIRWSDAEPLAIAFYRVGFTTLLLLPFVLLGQRSEIAGLGKKKFVILIAIGLVLAAHFSLWITSLGMTSVASSVILVTAHPLLVATVSYYAFKERLYWLNIVGIFIAIGGVVVLTFGDFSQQDSLPGNNVLLGDILALVGGICAGLYILGGRKMRKDLPLLTYAFIVYMFCTVFLLVACLATSTPLAPLAGREYLLFLIMALIPGILGHTLYNWSLKHVTATVVSVSLLGEPIGSSLLAFLLLDETPSVFVWLGGPLVLAGIVLTSINVQAWRRKKQGANAQV
jgi:drug/metabolite transporter (DMT)-like permease